MKTSANGRALIEAFEGRFLTTYLDSVGVPTIGFGHTSAAGEPYVERGMTITAIEADVILADDLAKVERQVEQYIKVPLNQAQFDALVSFTFNLGPGNLSKSSLCRRLNAGDYMVANEFAKWNKAGGNVLKGLTRRRMAEAAMWTGDVAGALKIAGVAHPPPDVEPIPQKKRPKAVPGTAGAATGAALHILGLPVWAAVSIAFVVAVIAYLIIKKRNTQ